MHCVTENGAGDLLHDVFNKAGLDFAESESGTLSFTATYLYVHNTK